MSRPPSRRAKPLSWAAAPLVPVAIAFIFGILLADYWPCSPTCWTVAVAGLTLLTGGMLWRKTAVLWQIWLSSILLLLLTCSIAGWRTRLTDPTAHPEFFQLHWQPGDLLLGTIASLKPATTRMRAEVTVTHLSRDSCPVRPVVGKIYLYLPPEQETAQLRAGDRLLVSGTPVSLSPPRNPFVFDFQAYAARRGIHHSIFLRTAAEWQHFPRPASSLRAIADQARRRWFQILQRHLAGDELAVAAALVLGQRDQLSREIQSAYADTGAVHVLAVSGLHVGIIFLLLHFFLVRLLQLDRTLLGRWFVALSSILCVWAFAIVSGLSPSVQRAAVMFTVLALGRINHRSPPVFNVLAFAAIVMLVYDPQQLFYVGFQLSFAALAGIVLFTNHLEKSLYLPTRILRWCWSAMAASTGAQLGTLPLSLHYFGQFPVWFLASGTLVIVSAFVIMAGGLLLGLAGWLAPDYALTSFLGQLLGYVVLTQNALVCFFRDLPGGLLYFPVFPPAAALLLSLGIGFMAAFFRWRNPRAGLIGLLIFSGTIIWARTQVQGLRQKAGAVIYHANRSSLFDIHDTEGAFTFGPATAAGPFVTEGYRKQYDYTPTTVKLFSLPDTTLTATLRWQAPLLHVQGQRWLLLAPGGTPPTSPQLDSLDLILIQEGFPSDQLPVLPSNSRPTIVLDGSNPPWHHAAWRTAAAAQHLPLWITAEAGAWVKDTSIPETE